MTPQRGANEASNTSGGVSTKGPLPSFWIPMLTPQAQESKVEKPDKTIYCPMSGKRIKIIFYLGFKPSNLINCCLSFYLRVFMNLLNAGKPLKFKDMIEVKFTLLDKADADNDGQKLIAKEERYKVIHNIHHCARAVSFFLK